MERGWLCLWRKIEDSSSWSRGADYRGLMITILQKANWKDGYFMGDKIKPGQFATSAINLSKELGLTRQRVQRMISILHKDGFIIVSNMRNRYTLISLVNWDTYQEIKKTREQPVSNQWATGEQPVSNHRAQSNKETRKQGNKETINNYTSELAVQTFDFETFNGRMIKKIIDSIQEIDQDCKIPTTDKQLKAWEVHLDRLSRIDKRTESQIEWVINWVSKNNFWKKNIRSTSKLREKFDQLVAQIQSENKKHKTGHDARIEHNNQVAHDFIKEMLQEAENEKR